MADAKPAVERLSEDESLRGDLSDIGFGPLLDWAVAAVTAYAPKAADSAALDAYTSRVRGVIQSGVQAAQDSKLDDPNALLDFDPADRDKVLNALKAVKFGDDPDDNAVQIAAALQTGFVSGSPAEAPVPAPEAAASAQPETNSTAEATAAAAKAFEAAAHKEVAQEALKQETATAPAEPAPSPVSAPKQEAAQPSVKKNEESGPESASPPPPPEQNLNPEPTANPAPSNPRPGTFLDTLRSTVGQTYNSAWGIFKGISKRRSG